MAKKQEKVQVILNGEKIVGTRFFKRDLDRLTQEVEYRGQRLKDPAFYYRKSDRHAMLWEARRILIKLFESDQPAEGREDVQGATGS